MKQFQIVFNTPYSFGIMNSCLNFSCNVHLCILLYLYRAQIFEAIKAQVRILLRLILFFVPKYATYWPTVGTKYTIRFRKRLMNCCNCYVVDIDWLGWFLLIIFSNAISYDSRLWMATHCPVKTWGSECIISLLGDTKIYYSLSLKKRVNFHNSIYVSS